MAFGQKPKDNSTGALGRILDRVGTGSAINQIRGLAGATSTGQGIPKHVTRVAATVSNASSGATCVMTITFHRDPSDLNFSTANVFVQGYNGNNSDVQIASGSSPITVVLNNTGEQIVVKVQANGNSGSAPMRTAPTTGVQLPKSSFGGFGTNSSGGITGAGVAGVLTVWTGKTSIGGGNLTGDVLTNSNTNTVVDGIQTVSVSNSVPNTGDVLRYNAFGDSKWDIASSIPRFIAINADVTNILQIGHGDAPVVLGTLTTVASSGTESPGRAYASAATASTNVTAGVRWGWAASLGADAMSYGAMYRYTTRLKMNNTTNARYWIGLTDGATGDFAGGNGLSVDAPNRKLAAFRYSDGVDATIKAVCSTSNVAQTVVDTGLAVDTSNSKLFEIAYTGSAFRFYVDGVLKATISTNIPAATDRFGTFWCSDNKNQNTAIGATFYNSVLTLK